jgi:hypothetical protein
MALTSYSVLTLFTSFITNVLECITVASNLNVFIDVIPFYIKSLPIQLVTCPTIFSQSDIHYILKEPSILSHFKEI